jgi:hypothetical protein
MKTSSHYFEHKRKQELEEALATSAQIKGTLVEEVVTTPPINEKVSRTRKICTTADFRNNSSDKDIVTVGMLRNIFGNNNATDMITGGASGWNLSCGVSGSSYIGNLFTFISTRLPNQNQPMRNISIVNCGSIKVQNQFWRDAENIPFARISIYSYWGADAFRATLMAHEYANDGNHRYFLGVMCSSGNKIQWKEIALLENVQAYIQEREQTLWTEMQAYVEQRLQQHEQMV